MSDIVATHIDHRGVATLTLNRPDKRNAFDAETIGALHASIDRMEQDDGVRVVVLTGAGTSFCAGADIDHMQRMGAASERENFEDALALARCLHKLDACDKPVIARVNGHAFGGGVGLIACADIAIACSTSRFALSEVRLGLVAAAISPYVVAAMGARQMRRLALTGEIFDAEQALRLQLIHQHAAAGQFDAEIERQIALLLQGGPIAQQASKRMIHDVAGHTPKQRDFLATHTAKLLARLRRSEEADEGLQAFLQKRKPKWSPE